MKFSLFHLFTLAASGTSSFLAHARLNDESTRALHSAQGEYIISLRSPSTACPGGRLVAQVYDSQGQPIPKAQVKFLLQGGSDRPYRRTASTNSRGRAAFDFVLRETTLALGEDLSCSIEVQNPNLFLGYQTVPCSEAIRVCPGQSCSVNSGSVVCEGDMMFDSECQALAWGMDLVNDCESLGCSSNSGDVVCQGDMMFHSECDAEDFGMNVEEDCEPLR